MKQYSISLIKYTITLACAFSLCIKQSLAEDASALNQQKIAELQEKSASGDAEAQYQLAKYYFSGKGVEKDEKRAFELTKSAAEMGHPEAMTNLGYFFHEGITVDKDDTTAMEWYRKAAAAGSAKAKLNIGLLIRKGQGAEKNNQESLKWMQEAADAGLVEAQSILGQIYFLGDTLQSNDYAKAIPLLLAAEKSGDPVVLNMLGVAFRQGYGGLHSDLEKAESYFRAAAQKNDKKAQANLAKILGIESPNSPRRKEALKWLLVAEKQGEPTASMLYNNLKETFPAVMLLEAEKDASRFALMQSVKQNKSKKSGVEK